MPRTISATVGRASANRHDDVVTVQELLNQVPPDEGGPQPVLTVDGLCGPKTNAAIQKFQLHHFGWGGADGRVEPGRQTIAKLNEYDRPSRKPAPAKLASTQFTIRRVDDSKIVLPTEGYGWFFEVRDLLHPASSSHVYYLGNMGAIGVPTYFGGPPSRFTTNRPYTASGLECPASYRTFQHHYRGQHSQTYMEWRSELELRLSSGTIRIPFDAHLVEPDFDGYRRQRSYERRGTFRSIRYYR
jgi:hypothetical protein